MNRRKFLRSLSASAAGLYASRLQGFTQRSADLPGAPVGGPAPIRTLENHLNYVPAYGQSLSLGIYGVPALSTVQRFDSLMFSGGMFAQSYNSDLAEDYGTLIPLVEVEDDADAPYYSVQNLGPHGETTVSGTFEAIKELIHSQDGFRPQRTSGRFLGSCPGKGGQPIAELTVGTAPYKRLLYEATQGLALATAAGLTYGVPCVTWAQGESDLDAGTTKAAYLAALLNLFQHLNTDLKAITGQTNDVQFIMYQTARLGCFRFATAQYEVAQQMANVHIGTPCYPFQTDGAPWNDGVHLANVSYKWMGAYFGSAYKRLVINGESWLPLSPATISAEGNVITIKLNVYGGAKVVADTQTTTTTNPIKPSLGFSLLDAAGNSLDIDNQVAVSGSDELTITAPEAVTTGFVLQYGNAINGYGGGNIRDNYGDQYVFNGGGLNLPMHNWLTVFSYQFP